MLDRIQTVLLVPNPGKPEVSNLLAETIEWFSERGIRCLMTTADRQAIPIDCETSDSDVPPVQLVIAFGGDGTVLHAVQLLKGERIPVVGINIGKLGFMTAVESHSATDLFQSIVDGQYSISSREMIRCDLSTEAEKNSFVALNEIVIGKTERERMVRMSTYINGEFFTRYSGDGLIFSTATGSTAYSLSAGGPIVTPGLKCILMTPICPHMLFSRPMVLSPTDRIRVDFHEKVERLALSIDGRKEMEVPPEATLEISLHEGAALILEPEGSSFYRTVREKFMTPSGPSATTAASPYGE